MSKNKKANTQQGAYSDADNALSAEAVFEPDVKEIDGEATDVTLSAEQFAELKEGVASLQGERDTYFDRLQRLQAEFDNYRKRNASLRQDSFDEGQREAVLALLPVLDNLERAVASAEADDPDSPLLEGVRLVYRQFVEALQKMGVEEIQCQGMPFDPELHNAIAQEACQNDQTENTVTEVFQKGYKQGDRVIRHPMVKVAQ